MEMTELSDSAALNSFCLQHGMRKVKRFTSSNERSFNRPKVKPRSTYETTELCGGRTLACRRLGDTLPEPARWLHDGGTGLAS
jgi:hypothetical protein